MILFFDTETTGTISENLSFTDRKQPHIVEIAAILTNDIGDERCSMDLIVDPGIEIPEKVSQIHGITTKMARKYGVYEQQAVYMFMLLFSKADLLVAHNIDFDIRIVNIQLARMGMNELHINRTYDTMKETTDLLKIPNSSNLKYPGKYKRPKLSELHKYLFNEDFKAHNALEDTKACKRCFFELKKRGL